MSFYSLSRDEISTRVKRAWTYLRVNGVEVPAKYADRQYAIDMLGIREAKEGEPYRFKTTTQVEGKKVTKRYCTDRNTSNRPVRMSDVAKIADMILKGRFVLNGETFVFGDDEKAISAQHRLIALFVASETEPDVSIPVLEVTGVPAEFADTNDTGRGRSAGDIAARQDWFADVHTLTGTDTYGEDTRSVQAALSKDLASVTRVLSMRMQGKDVTGGGDFDHEIMFTLESVFPDLQALVERTYAYDMDSGKSRHRKLGRANIAAALALWFGRNCDPIDPREPGEAVVPIPVEDDLAAEIPHRPRLSDYVEGDVDPQAAPPQEYVRALERYQEAVRQVEELREDRREFACDFLRELNRASVDQASELYEAYRHVTDKNKRFDRKQRFGALCNMIEAFFTKDIVTSADVVPRKYSGQDRNKKAAYRHFGGIDIGYQVKSKAGTETVEPVEDDEPETVEA